MTVFSYGDRVECDVNGDWDEPLEGFVVAAGERMILVRHVDNGAATTLPPCRYHREEVRAVITPEQAQAAMDLLAEWGSREARKAHPEYEYHDALRDFMRGAVEAQVTDPDWRQAEETARWIDDETNTTQED